MNERIVTNANFRIWIPNCRGGKIKCKNNTRCNSTKGEQVQKVVMWHWCIVMSERNGLFMLHFKNFWLLKSPTVCRNCTELTGIRKEEITYILLTIFKYRYNTKKNNKGLNSNKRKLQSVAWFTLKGFISEWQFEQTKKVLHETTSCIALSISCAYFLLYAWKHVKFHYE